MAIENKPRAMMIIHNYPPAPSGGTELQAEQLATKLVGLGHTIHVMTAHPRYAMTFENIKDAPSEEIINGVQIHRTPFPLAYYAIKGSGNTFGFLIKNLKKYDILHCQMAYGHAVVAVVVARIFRKKCIIKIACAGEYGELYDFSKFQHSALGFEILHQADRMIAISHEVEEELLRYGFSPDRIIHIPNGVDTDKFTRAYPFPIRDKIRFLVTGRRHPQKGIDVLLEAVKILKEAGLGDRFEVILYGRDYPQHNYRQMALEFGITHQMEFLPFNPNLLKIYHQVHAFLLPSRGEGLSNALLEAMSMELPVIVSNVSGMADVVDDGLNGMLIPRESPQALASAMTRIITDPEYATQIGQNARRKVESFFSLDSIARQYSELYQNLCQ